MDSEMSSISRRNFILETGLGSALFLAGCTSQLHPGGAEKVESERPYPEYQESDSSNYSEANSEYYAKRFPSYYESGYVGRIIPDDSPKELPQGMCMISDTIGWFAFACEAAKKQNAVDLYKVNIHDGTVLAKVTQDFGHCNGIAYDQTHNVVYVCPCYDYTNSSKRYEVIYECDPATLEIRRVHTYSGMNPHSICVDKKTGRVYVTFEETRPYAVRLCEVDISTDTIVREYGRISDVKPNYALPMGGGSQTIAAYDDVFFYSFGKVGMEYIIVFNQDMHYLNTININRSVFIYCISELQGIDITSNGDIVFFSRATTELLKKRVGLIGCINISGKFGHFDVPTGRNKLTYVSHLVQRDINAIIRPTGDKTSPFATFAEAVSSVIAGYNNSVRFDSDVRVTEPLSQLIGVVVSIQLGNHILSLDSDLVFEGSHITLSSNSHGIIKGLGIVRCRRSTVIIENISFDYDDTHEYIAEISSSLALLSHITVRGKIDKTHCIIDDNSLIAASNCVNITPNNSIFIDHNN